MECRKLELTLVSADNLPDVRILGQMKVYAEVSLKGESKTTVKTPVDMGGETNPRWNFHVDYTVSESTVRQTGVDIVVKLFCKRSFGDKFIGEVNVPVKSLFDVGLKAEKILSYSVAGTPNGRLNILYSFGEKFLVEKPSGWKSAIGVAFLVLVGGALTLLGKDDDNDEGRNGQYHTNSEFSRDHVRVDGVDDGEIFYDAL